jgi:hypothetical protein
MTKYEVPVINTFTVKSLRKDHLDDPKGDGRVTQMDFRKTAQDHDQWWASGLSMLNVYILLPGSKYILYICSDNKGKWTGKLLTLQELSNFKNHYKPQ